jgi:hypothetical protein
MANIEPSGGHVTLRGHAVAIDSDIGHQFTVDCCRFVEGLVTEEQLKAKYKLDDDAWRALASNEPLQQRVGAEKTRRIHSGDCAREKAQHLLISCPDVLGGILNDTAAPVRSRIDAIREVRVCAQTGLETNNKPTSERERFIININFGQHSVRKIVDAAPIEPLPSKLIEPAHDEEDDGYEWEYEPDL